MPTPKISTYYLRNGNACALYMGTPKCELENVSKNQFMNKILFVRWQKIHLITKKKVFFGKEIFASYPLIFLWFFSIRALLVLAKMRPAHKIV